MTLQAIRFDQNKLQLLVLNQLLIPFQTKYIRINSISDAFDAIKKMQVRGAPAIAIVGVFSIVVELNYILNVRSFSQTYYDLNDIKNFKANLFARIQFLVSSRPTAVNLSNACNDIVQSLSANDQNNITLSGIYQTIYNYAVDLESKDLKNNYLIGENGADFILTQLQNQNFSGEFSVLTICNTGSLATAAYGTALGIIRKLWSLSPLNYESDEPTDGSSSKKLKRDFNIPHLAHVFPLETRPYNQGSRLTSYELIEEKIPSTLITDSMVSFLIKSIKSKNLNFPPIKFIIVGADRIAKNGDTANKIGTFQLSQLAYLNPEIGFIVAAPTTTIDQSIDNGDHIVVEERPAAEFQNVTGGLIDPTTNNLKLNQDNDVIIAKVLITPQNMNVWNPSFDITESKFIDAIVTEEKYYTKDSNNNFNL
ncbi:S-methyl-5-thioribose-1-phosphate isomerase MRI1 [Ascoidea rubescens DSM 1968]|uniref:Methylthioribose-1-phosphate isomerase n=1 Tax=Ascoidea rubescens DSM 1968 TaxID=1344418 RepID=A0A1D2VF49_9ASCO|nr:Methylthioribose-1-phosphate isomerase [Ascoidea rubescens DSM 1968]ODV60281.1 Methylthioribose-1-phosphate isomerase [Ascoidea rubescens DSM 1968]